MGRFAEALADVRRLRAGDSTGFRRTRVSQKLLSDFTPQEIRAVRVKAKMPQWLFAFCLGVAKKTVEAWEGGRSRPDGAASRLLGLVRDDPAFFQKTGVYVRETLQTPETPPTKK